MVQRRDIVAAARGWIGTPYRHQASLKLVGCDCLGLVRGVWRETVGAEPQTIPSYGAGWTDAGTLDVLAEACGRYALQVPYTEFEAGDILLFRWRRHLPARHAGIASSAALMVHAQEGAAAAEIPLNGWWRRHLAYAFRFPGVED